MSEQPQKKIESPVEDAPQQAQPEERKPPSKTVMRKRQQSVIHYVAILFAAAFVLLLLTFLMERRQSAEIIGDLNQSIEGIQNSHSALQSVQGLYEENASLRAQVADLEEELQRLEGQQQHMLSQLEQTNDEWAELEKVQIAMDWFWQINEAYVRGRNNLARSLIESIEEAGLVEYLPKESATDTDRLSPRDKYQEMYEAYFGK